eukprot:CAMPEP_0171458550 /NCGR_PEP_ID=MMETSP0945-20130129/4184_1 /TAXON_ID=109269 /ORGANISM="Vaucheria litorea, Strain CCMP2940" /LENGTH=102 /DNA_ID=CAMNT_0011984381 /DNA_START=325 /DNA_END=630 /DNA_ORIENTATION=-
MTTANSLNGFILAWTNTYGLILIVLLMGYGLVEVPRQLWLKSDKEKLLRKLYFRTSQIDSELYDAKIELEELYEKFEETRKNVLENEENLVFEDKMLEILEW